MGRFLSLSFIPFSLSLGRQATPTQQQQQQQRHGLETQPVDAPLSQLLLLLLVFVVVVVSSFSFPQRSSSKLPRPLLLLLPLLQDFLLGRERERDHALVSKHSGSCSQRERLCVSVVCSPWLGLAAAGRSPPYITASRPSSVLDSSGSYLSLLLLQI